MSDSRSTPQADGTLPARGAKKKMTKKDWRRLATGLAFVSPNILGFLAFTLIPLGFSLVLAFSNWDLRQHNMFKDESIELVGFYNFFRLYTSPKFWKYLGNTLFLMMGLPIGIAGSLGAALLLTKDLKVSSRRVFLWLLGGGMILFGAIVLAGWGLGATAIVILVMGIAGLMLVGGMLGGQTVYRTLFFLPHFCAGVAIFILWKKMYNPTSGPINTFLAGPLTVLGDAINWMPGWLVQSGMWLALVVIAFILYWGSTKLREFWSDGELGIASISLASLFLVLPVPLAIYWSAGTWPILAPTIVVAVLAIGFIAYRAHQMRDGPDLECALWDGLGSGLMLALVLMVAQLILYGLGRACYALPGLADLSGGGPGLTPPEWLQDTWWAKPSIMIMGLWAAIGGNTMLLYIAGLSNVPTELYEAASIDGASRFQRFWHVTWPQLAPVTFFVIVMGMIGGLQGGFEMARTMTQGGPNGATTTLSYFIYTEGFENVELGFASAVAWALFIFVFTVTMFNWKFGSQYVNE